MHNNKTILCVEDHGDTCELISAVFPEYKITSVDSVADGHYMIGRSEFDLYLFDYHLPDGTGEDLCRYLRGRGAEQPVVIFTGSSWISGSEAARFGANDVVRKAGAWVADLVRSIERWMVLPPQVHMQLESIGSGVT